MFKLCQLLLFQFRLIFIYFVLNPFRNKLISSESLSYLDISDHEIGEFGNMTRILKNNTGSNTSGINFKHILLEHKMVPP